MKDAFLSIRRLTRRDGAAFARLVRAAWHRDYSGVGEYYMRTESLPAKVRGLVGSLGGRPWRWLGAFDPGTGRLVGAAGALTWHGRYWLGDVFVAPRWRRQGVATRLLRALLRGRRGPAYAEVNARNAASRKLVAKLGFRVVLTDLLVRRP
ncbi:MAG: GNAT family N-acetyltransferase [Planctomycetales bacterium]|nr:GNAT family N-acetyltransferase [Planctomycetales bacterium]